MSDREEAWVCSAAFRRAAREAERIAEKVQLEGGDGPEERALYERGFDYACLVLKERLLAIAEACEKIETRQGA